MYLNCYFQHSVLSVLPRLDDTEELVGATNSWMESACAMQNANFWDVTDNFPYSRTELWKWKDQIHLSVNFGLPLLMDIIVKISMEPKREGMVPIQTTCLPWLQKNLRNFWKAPVKRALGKSNYLPNKYVCCLYFGNIFITFSYVDDIHGYGEQLNTFIYIAI